MILGGTFLTVSHRARKRHMNFEHLNLRFRGPGRRSLGPKAKKSQKSLEKSLPGPGPKSPKKVSKKVRKVKKKSENGFWEVSHIKSVQTRCIVKGEAQKSPTFLAIFWGFLIFSGSPVL